MPVRTGTENLVPIGIGSPAHPARSESVSQHTLSQLTTLTVTAGKCVKMNNGQ